MFLSALSASIGEFPLRPLLLAAEVAATAAGFFYHIDLGDEERAPADPKDTTGPKVCEQVTEPEPVLQKQEVSKTQKLEERVKELEALLCEAHRDYDLKTKECEQEQETRIILQTEMEEMKKTFTTLEKESKEMKRTITHQEELLKVSQDEVDIQHEMDEEAITWLKVEKYNLINQVKNLRRTLRDMKKKLFHKDRQIGDLVKECEREQEAHSILQTEMDKMKKTLTKLRNKNKETKRVLTQKEELLKECEREQEAHSILQTEMDKMKKTLTKLRNKNKETKRVLTQKEELLKECEQKVSLAEANKKHQDEKTIAQLEVEKNNLTKRVKNLKETLKDTEKQLFDKQLQCVDLMKEHERGREAHSFLQKEYDELLNILIQKEESLKKQGQPLVFSEGATGSTTEPTEEEVTEPQKQSDGPGAKKERRQEKKKK